MTWSYRYTVGVLPSSTLQVRAVSHKFPENHSLNAFGRDKYKNSRITQFIRNSQLYPLIHQICNDDNKKPHVKHFF